MRRRRRGREGRHVRSLAKFERRQDSPSALLPPCLGVRAVWYIEAMGERLPAVVIPAQGTATASIVWMHGLGADGHDFEEIAPLLRVPHARFVFPHADRRAVTINGGMVMRAWYDILSLDWSGARESSDDIALSRDQIEAWIAHERGLGIPSSRIVLAGFSQGAAMAVHVGLRYAEPLAGILGLSGYAVVPETFEREAAEAQRSTPVLLCHGTADPVVPYDYGRRAHELIATWSSAEVRWESFPIGHQVSLPEIEVVGAWLRERLA